MLIQNSFLVNQEAITKMSQPRLNDSTDVVLPPDWLALPARGEARLPKIGVVQEWSILDSAVSRFQADGPPVAWQPGDVQEKMPSANSPTRISLPSPGPTRKRSAGSA
ncbi:hypothetical protein [Collimonas sp. PA-H2]|uniref:hypothetical protein n=1 Tax=Collimonas sp. PA-H2 TaxID=1881062 RepID=UPI00117F97CC|nr:hypothetical protein [Collimonas sp. PA-H2]